MYCVYVLESEKDGKLYYGFSDSLERRLHEHNTGQVKSTKHRTPLRIIYFEEVETVQDARKRERYFKSGFGRKYIKGKINNKALSSNG